MAIRLFHRTTRDAVDAILAEGFRNGDDDVVWFSCDLDCRGEQGRWLLEVMIDLSENALDSYAIGWAEDEECVNVETDQWVKIDEFESGRWFKIPADVVNAKGRVRLVPPAEIPFLFEEDED